jgi:type I restriction enzyme S subunit
MTTIDTLPPGWRWASVAELALKAKGSITDGPFGSNLKTEHYTTDGPRVVRLQNIGDGRFLDERACVSVERFEALRKHEVRRGDVLVALLGEVLPRACVAPSYLGPAIVKADCVRLRVDPGVASAEYVCHALNAEQTRRRTSAIVHGVGRPRLNLGELKELTLPLAPRGAQDAIVATIDAQLSRIDAGATLLECAARKLKAFRASVLRAACRGELVPTEAELARRERRTYEPADRLLCRILEQRRRRWESEQGAKTKLKGQVPAKAKWQSKYKPPTGPDTRDLAELPEGWCWTTVDAVGDVLLGRQRAPQFLTGEWYRPYLRVANVKDDRLDFNDIEQMDFDPVHFEKYKLQPGDILVSEGQSPELVGQSAIYSGGIDGLCFQKTLHRFRPVAGGPSAKFAQIVFRSHVKNGLFMKLASITTNIAHLTLEKFEAAPFPLPPAAEQERIVAEVDRLMSFADQAERAVEVQLARARRLRAAVLRDAFEGKLTSVLAAEAS